MQRIWWAVAGVVLVAATLVAATPAASPNFPARIDFPPGWQAEGIAVGRGHTFYAGNTATGAIYAGDLRTGEGAVLVSAPACTSAFGVFVDNFDRMWVAGGRTGTACVYDAKTGALLARYQLAPSGATFINDLYVTKDAAYFTDTTTGLIYEIPLGVGGELGTTVEVLNAAHPIPGANGIEATPNGDTLVVVSITTNQLFTVDAVTGATSPIAVDAPVLRGDGLILQGKTLYVVQNMTNGSIAVVNLSPDLSTGHVVGYLNADDAPLVNPATADRFGHLIYVVRRNNAPAGPTRVFWLSRVTIDKS